MGSKKNFGICEWHEWPFHPHIRVNVERRIHGRTSHQLLSDIILAPLESSLKLCRSQAMPHYRNFSWRPLMPQ